MKTKTLRQRAREAALRRKVRRIFQAIAMVIWWLAGLEIELLRWLNEIFHLILGSST